MKGTGFAICWAMLMLAGCAPPETHDNTAGSSATESAVSLFPAQNDTGINPDTHLTLTFATAPEIGTSGLIRITDAETGSIVDQIDMSLPTSPRPDGKSREANQAARVALGRDTVMSDYQVNTVGGVQFHYRPVIIRGNTAMIDLHNQSLDYGRTYKVSIEPDVLNLEGGFNGVSAENGWTFTTKPQGPADGTSHVVVAADGSGDFSTLQGALDFAPAQSDTTFRISINNGNYEEIIYLADKSDIVIHGESRDGVQVGYANNSSFNPPRTGPSRRPAFSMENVEDIQLSDFTINNYFKGQAEALLVSGERVAISNMQLNGSGDALTTYGSIYMVDSELTGDGDTILGYASLYCLRCTIRSIGAFTWTRTPEGKHGNVFVDSTFIQSDTPYPWSVTAENPEGEKGHAVLARLPRNGPSSAQSNFPFAEMVLINTRTDGLPPEGWGPVEPEPEFDWSNVRLWEFNTMDMDGIPVDMSQRHPIARELAMPEDADLIEQYSDPAFVLDGWTPVLTDSAG